MRAQIICFLTGLFGFTFACLPDGGSEQVRIGYDTYICVTIAPLVWASSGSFVRLASVVKADNFSNINIQRSWTSKNYSSDAVMSKLKINQTRGSGLGVAVESMGLISYQRAYRQVISTGENTTASVTYPLMMAVVHVTKGKVTSINWDDQACVWCQSKSSQCGQNVYDYDGNVQPESGKACWVPDAECAVKAINGSRNSTATSLCELSVYITWTGTDSRGLYFKSSASRFSRMSSTQLAEYTTSRQAIHANDNIP